MRIGTSNVTLCKADPKAMESMQTATVIKRQDLRMTTSSNLATHGFSFARAAQSAERLANRGVSIDDFVADSFRLEIDTIDSDSKLFDIDGGAISINYDSNANPIVSIDFIGKDGLFAYLPPKGVETGRSGVEVLTERYEYLHNVVKSLDGLSDKERDLIFTKLDEAFMAVSENYAFLAKSPMDYDRTSSQRYRASASLNNAIPKQFGVEFLQAFKSGKSTMDSVNMAFSAINAKFGLNMVFTKGFSRNESTLGLYTGRKSHEYYV